MRAGEIFNLKWNDVKPSFIRIRNPKSKQDEEKIPSLPWLHDFIQSLPKTSFYVIDTNQKSTNTFKKIWVRAKADLGLDRRATFHWFRHSFASYLSDHEVPLKYIQALLRHADLSTTDIYLHANFKKMREEMMKIRGIFDRTSRQA